VDWTWSRHGESIATIRAKVELGQVSLQYNYRKDGDDWESLDYPVTLVTTPCHYGGGLDTGSPVQPWGVAKGSSYCIWAIDTLPALSVINSPTAAREKLLMIVALEGQVRLGINSIGSRALPILSLDIIPFGSGHTWLNKQTQDA
jgi:hypothetical protein